MSKEIWLPVKDYEGLYEVSSCGRVRSLDRNIDHGQKGIVFKKGIIRKQRLSNMGYYTVGLRNYSKPIVCTVHRLECIAFKPNPDNKPCVNHKDGIKTNNELSNLEWATYSENEKHAYDTGLSPILNGKDHHRSKAILQLSINGDFIAEFESSGDAYRKIKIDAGNIRACCSGKVKTAGGFKWKHVK